MRTVQVRDKKSDGFRFAPPILRSLCGVFFIMLIWSAFNRSADIRSENLHDENDKTWYFSFGKTVFERPYSSFKQFDLGWTILTPIDPRNALIPPNPHAPVGCKDNPQQLSELYTSDWPTLERDDF
jgi:hypothetical protein